MLLAFRVEVCAELADPTVCRAEFSFQLANPLCLVQLLDGTFQTRHLLAQVLVFDGLVGHETL